MQKAIRCQCIKLFEQATKNNEEKVILVEWVGTQMILLETHTMRLQKRYVQVLK